MNRVQFIYNNKLLNINKEKILYFFYIIFMAALYLFNRNIAAKSYYIISFLFLIYIIFIRDNGCKLKENKLYISSVLLVLYSLASSIILNGINSPYIKSSLRLVLFLSATIIILKNKKNIITVLNVIMLSTFLGSLPDLYDYFMSNDYPKAIRFAAENKYLVSIYAGGVYSISAIISLHLVFNSKHFQQKVIYSFFLVYLSALVYLSQSRAAILSFLLSGMLYLILRKRINYKYIVIALTISSIFCWFVNSWVFKITSLFQRKDSGRFEIWEESLDMIMEKFIFGHGLGADFQLYISTGEKFTEPHNLYLYVLFTGGVVCLFLLLFLYWTAIVTIYRNWNCEVSPFLSSILLFIIIFNFFDSRMVVDDIGVGWSLFWVPVGIITAYSSIDEPVDI